MSFAAHAISTLIQHRKRKLRQRLQELKADGCKAHTSGDFWALREQAQKLAEQSLKGTSSSGSDATGDEAAAAAGAAGASGGAADVDDAAATAAAADGVPVLPPDAPTVTFIIKGDVQGSVEAVSEAVTSAAAGRAAVRFVYSGVGPITTSDVHLAATTGAKIVAFNIPAPSGDADSALRNAPSVEVMQHNVIYHLLDEVMAVVAAAEAGAVGGASGVTEEVVGSALVMAVFPMIQNRKEVGKVAGVRVQDGTLSAGSGVVYRVLRDGQVVFEGPISSLKQQRNAVSAVGKGNECGVALAEGSFADYQPGDIVQCVSKRTVRG